MDLSKSEYDTMNVARAVALPRTSYVYKIPCADLVSPLNYTAVATQSTDWTKAGSAKHAVVSAKGATRGSGFNKTKVNSVKANKYLLSKAVYVTND